MIKRLLAWKLRLFILWMDESVPAEKLHAYLEKHKSKIGTLPVARDFSPAEILDWNEAVRKDKKKIWQEMGAFQREMILFLDGHGTRVQKEKVCEIMELLLRQVEVRRKKSFFLNDMKQNDMDQIWQQRHETSILFCEFAARHDDLRYLNASFKMNDWAFHHYRRSGKHRSWSMFLLALDIQERTARGFSICE